MKTLVFVGLLFLTATFTDFAQEPQKSDDPAKDPVSQSDTSKTDVTKQQSNTSSTDSAAPAPSQDYTRPDAKTRFKRYLNSMFGPMSLGEDIALAGIATARNSPEEWGPHWDGFGRRVASGIGRSVIKNTVQYSLDETFKLDSHYYRSKDRSVSARIKNALISPVTARREDGTRTIGFPHIIGVYAGSIISRKAWYPARYTLGDDLVNGSISLGFNVGMNLVKEFIWKK
jgi:hypothetical protein